MFYKKLVFFLIFCIKICYCQQAASIWYDTDNGLPQNSIKDITKDKYGFIWLSTENGIVRYDGKSFIVSNHSKLKNNRFTFFFGNIIKDSIYNFSAFNENAILACRRKATISNQYSGFLKQILRECKTNSFFIKNGVLNAFSQNDYFIYFNKNDYYHLKSNGIILFNDRNQKKIKISNSQYILDTFCFDNSIFIISKNVKKVIKITSGKVTYLNAPKIFFEKECKIYWSQINNQTFIAYHNILYKVLYHRDVLSLEKLTNYNFERKSVASIYHDEDNNKIYIGTLSTGLNILKFNKFHVVTKSNKSDDNIFYSQLPFENDKVITPEGDVFNKTKLIKQYNFNNKEKFISLYDDKENIIIKSGSHLVRFFKKDNFSTKQILSFKRKVHSIYKVNNYYCIVFYDSTHKSYLVFYKDATFTKPFLQFFFPNSIVTNIKQYNKDQWLVGTRVALYLVGSRPCTIQKISMQNILNVREIVQTNDGNFWIFTQGSGFFLYKDKKLVKMPIDQDKFLLFSHSLLEDQNGYFWIATNNGLFRILKENLLAYYKNQNNIVNYYRYTKEDGFNTNEFNGGCTPSSTVLPNGNFVLPSINGLVFFNPKEIKNYYPTDFFIEQVKFYDPISTIKNGNIYLENNFYKAEISIDIPYYANRSNLVVEAKLEGSKNNNWEKVNTEGKYFLTNLNPGNYRLIIRVLSSPEGTYIYKTLNINVKYIFYQTLTFKIIILLLIIYFILRLRRLRIETHEANKRMLELIIEERTKKLVQTVEKLEYTKSQLRKESIQQKKLLETISHDIITPVKFLSITARKLYETDQHDHYIQKKHFESFYKSSLEFYNFVKTLKEYAEIYNYNTSQNEKLYNLCELIESKKNLFETASKEQNNIIINNVRDGAYSNINQNVMAVIIHNLIDNAIKNTKDGVIELSTIEDDKILFIEVRDTGMGMTDEQMKYYEGLQNNIEKEKLVLQKYSLGLHLILQLLMMINGKIEFKNNIPSGTIVSIKIEKNKYE